MKSVLLALGVVIAAASFAVAGCASSPGTAATDTTATSGQPSTTTLAITRTTASNTWTDLKPVGDLPPARSSPSMVYDPANGQVILFGGYNNDASGWTSVNDPCPYVFNDTWAYDPTANTWTDLEPVGDLPPARTGHSMVYDSASGQVILFGGFGDLDNLDDTWAYDPTANTWTDLKPVGDLPPAVSYSSMVYDSASGKVILFGGQGLLGDSWTQFNDTWTYDPAANTWTRLTPTGDLPPAELVPYMVYDSASGKVILFGGNGANDAYYVNDTWAYDPTANTWTDLEPAASPPPELCSFSMVYDSASDKVVLFGGSLGTGEVQSNDTWAYDPTANTWTDLKPVGDLPPVRELHSMVYDSASGQVILFGGVDRRWAVTALNDTWAYGGGP
jgi:N-acetylneuraminic acid mutarotase